MSPDIDARSLQFAEACWAFKRGERQQAPTWQEFSLHPHVATAIAAWAGMKLDPVRKAKPKTLKQQNLL